MGKGKLKRPDREEMAKDFGAAERLLSRNPDLLWRTVGAMVRLAGRTSLGRLLMERTGRLAGAALAEMEMFGMKTADGPVAAAGEWLKVLEALNCRYEVGKVTSGGVEVFMLECPAGLSEKNGKEVCLAGMSADRELVGRLGGRLLIGETIADGAGKCHLKVVRAES
ncbi:MAG: hypothetical protein AB1742_16260 [bacterium]